jgi:hypothetical protein
MNRKIAQYGIVIVLFISLFFVFHYDQILPKFPQTVHQWRQCDGSAIAMNYLHNGFKFFEPGVYNLHGNGKTVAEFPIIYFVDALLIKVFGEHHKHFIIRLVNLLISFLGAMYLFKIGLLIFKKWWWSNFPALLFISFPIVTYYAATSVPDVPALSFLFIGLFYCFQYLKDGKKTVLVTAILFISLAGVIKSTALIAYLAFCGVLFIDQMRRNKSFAISPKIFLYLAIPLLATITWIYWAKAYNHANENITFLMSAKPIWAIDRAYIDEISKRIKVNWIYEYVYLPILYFVAIGGLFVLLFPKKELNLIKLGIILLLLGTAAYFYLFFEQFYHHDYYAIELLPLVIAFYIAFLFGMEQVKFAKWSMHLFSFINIILLCLCIQYAAQNLNKRYTKDALYNNDKDVLIEIATLLREKGIEYSDKAIVSFDRTPNVSLFLLDQVGWTRFPYGIDEEMVKDYIDAGAKILITTSGDLKERPYLEPFIKDTLFEHKNVLAFNL